MAENVLDRVAGFWDARAEVADPELRAALPWLGVDAATLTAAVEPLVAAVAVHDLSDDQQLWVRPVHDERFALVARPS